MKKNPWIQIASAAVLLACLLSCAVCMTLSTSAEAEFVIAIPYGKPTVDGVIEDGPIVALMGRFGAASPRQVGAHARRAVMQLQAI